MSRIKCVSEHAEDLGDGRTRAPGELADDVDLIDDPVNARLLREGRIIEMSSDGGSEESAERRQIVKTTIDDAADERAAAAGSERTDG